MSIEERQLVVEEVVEEAPAEEEALTEINLSQPASASVMTGEQLILANSTPQLASSGGSAGETSVHSTGGGSERASEVASEAVAEQPEQEEPEGGGGEGGWEGVDLGGALDTSDSLQEPKGLTAPAAPATGSGPALSPAGQPAERKVEAVGGNNFGAVNLATTTVAAAAALQEPSGGGQGMPGYTARVMQQLAAAASEEDDLTVYRSTDMDAAAQSANEVLHHQTSGATADAAGPAAAPAANGSAVSGAERFEIDAAPRAQPQSPSAAEAARAAQFANDIWEQTFKGLLYADGVDSLGRPVVVINADAVPHNMRSSALIYCKWHLEPVVNKGHYVLVFTAKKATLPSMWIMGAYRSLPRPYRKNVQLIILVRPSGFLKAVLAILRPFVSRKAGRKIKQVESLQEIGEATGGEVMLQHLGQRFLAEVVDKD